MTNHSVNLEDKYPRFHNSLGVRVLLISICMAGVGLWYFSDLSMWHLAFFVLLQLSAYYSYSRYNLPLMVYMSMIFLYWIVAPLLQAQMGVNYYMSLVEIPKFEADAFLFCLIHLFGIFIGFHIKLSKDIYRRGLDKRFSFIGVIVSITVLIVLLTILGPDVIFLPRIEQAIAIETSNYMLFLENTVKLLPAFLMGYFIIESDKKLSPGVRKLIFILLLVLLITISNPVNTGRFISLYALLIIFLVHATYRKRYSLIAWVMVLAPFYAVVLLGVTSMARHGVSNIDFLQSLTKVSTLEFSSFTAFLDALQINEFPQGNYLLSHIFIFLPRSFWADKAGSIGIFSAESSGYVFSNVGLVSFFNAFADFGFIGLFVVSIIFGFLSRKFNPVAEVASFHNRYYMYGVIFTGVVPMIFRGDLSTAMIAFYAASTVYEFVRVAVKFKLA